jgi:hypothetical protein
MLMLSISFRGEARDLDIDENMTMGEFLSQIEEETHIPVDYMKLISPQVGVVKVDKLRDGLDTVVGEIFPRQALRRKIILMGTPMTAIQELQETEAAKAKEHARHLQRAQNMRRLARRPARTTQVVNTKYTFQRLAPLPGLAHPEKALAVLERLASDRGVRAIMEKHQWSVGVLSELDPASSTTHSSRLLGLNTGKGQMIQLRLRTDDYQGFCSYKEIRKVLCHELAHNVHSEHDKRFWELYRILEKEVVELDPFGHSGHQVADDMYDGPGFGADTDELLMCDDGGWFGSTQTLGAATTTTAGDSEPVDENLQAKMRRAAEDRRRHNGEGGV